MGKSMNDADRFWLCMDQPTNLMNIVGLMEFDAPIEFERLRATIEIRIGELELTVCTYLKK